MEIRGEAEHAVLRHYPLRVIKVGKSDPSVRVLQSEFGLGMVVPATAPLRVFFGAQPESRLPQQLPPGHAKALESTHPDQVLDRGAFESGWGATQEINQRSIGTAPFTLLDDLLGDVGPAVVLGVLKAEATSSAVMAPDAFKVRPARVTD